MLTGILLALLLGPMVMPVHGDSGPGAPEPRAARVLADFTPDSLRWFTVLDGVMGGRSSGDFQMRDGVMDFRGVLNTNGGGFSSVRSSDRAMNLTGFRGLRLRVRGDGRTYSVRIRQSGLRGGVTYRASFGTRRSAPGDAKAPGPWQTVWVPFSELTPQWRGRRLELPPLDPSKVTGLGVTMSDGVDGSFRIELDEIAAYGRFRLEELKGDRSALVVVGPSAEHPSVRAWREAHGAVLKEGQDDAPVFIQLVARGASFVGERALLTDELSDLRASIGMTPGDVGVRLILRDGTRVLQPAAPVAMESVLDAIRAPRPARRLDGPVARD
ncbi:CIA30 family protein [Planctomycetota bacterium]|nr:CIA30 family protein [Planctomycetota bacterium]